MAVYAVYLRFSAVETALHHHCCQTHPKTDCVIYQNNQNRMAKLYRQDGWLNQRPLCLTTQRRVLLLQYYHGNQILSLSSYFNFTHSLCYQITHLLCVYLSFTFTVNIWRPISHLQNHINSLLYRFCFFVKFKPVF